MKDASTPVPETAREAPSPRPASKSAGNGRRGLLRTLGKVGLGAALIGVPVLSRPRTVRAQSMDVTDVLNFALVLEYLEEEFYARATAADGLLSGEATEAFARIAEHESEHVALLQEALGDSALTRDSLTFDFSGGRGGQNGFVFASSPFESYELFLRVAQALEDTGVRAYKGQVASIPADLQLAGLNILTTALQVHASESRHAATVRHLRATSGGPAGLQPWVHEGTAPSDGPLGGVYAGEDNTTQVVDLASALSGDYTEEHIREAFGEPLTMDEVIDIVQFFVVQDIGSVLSGAPAQPIVAADFEEGILEGYTAITAEGASAALSTTSDVPPTNGGAQALRVEYDGDTDGNGEAGGYAFFRLFFEEIIDLSAFGDPYLNFYIKSPTALPDDFVLEINLQEDQELSGDFDGNGPVDDEFQTLFNINDNDVGDEYQLVSLRVDDFADDDAPFGMPGTGDGAFSDLVRVLLINAFPLPAQTFELYFDYFIFTDGPLDE